MKTTITSRLLSALVLTFFAAAMFTSCKKDEITNVEPKPFSKDIQVSDATGKNTVLVRVTAAQADYLETADWSKALEVKPMFETPTEEFTEKSGEEPNLENLREINFEILEENLEPGVKGVQLGVSPEKAGVVADRWNWVYTFTTSYNVIRVTANWGCHDDHYYRKLYSNSAYSWVFSAYNRCAYLSWTQGWSIPSYRMRVKVYYNSATFWVNAWN